MQIKIIWTCCFSNSSMQYQAMTRRHLRVKLRYCFLDPACSILSKDQLHRERSCFKTNPYPRIWALARSAFVWCECGMFMYCWVYVRVCRGTTDGNNMSVNEGCNLSPKMKNFSSIQCLASICDYIKWKFLHWDCSIIMSYFQNTSYHLCKGVPVWLAAPYTC